ncbi:nacht and wd domain [Fusarium longipes]|uniref:Nacht and wd domain n=1 Tax=Fusarium longipes TaxID=694270 RepID=A0A395SZ58_9HYPO|nr:nacht and wd domain [Fusarium longipes]
MVRDTLKTLFKRKKDTKSSSSLPNPTSLPPPSTDNNQQATSRSTSKASDSNTVDSRDNVVTGPPSTTEPIPAVSESSVHATRDLQERLWNQAYTKVNTDEPDMVKAYESLLLERSGGLEPEASPPPEHQTVASILRNPQRMEELVQMGIERSERIAKAKKNAEEFNRVAGPVKEVMKVVVQAAPQASIAWSCISFALEMLANPLTESSINREGITYVLGMMEWYWALVDLLLDENSPSPSVKDQVEKQIVLLYQKLLLYQMKSICRYFRNQIIVVLRDLVKLDDWAGELKGIQDAEDNLRKKLGLYQNASIVDRLKGIDSTLKKELGHISSLLEAQQERDEDNENRRWVDALRQTNPIDDKSRIQREKGDLVRDSCRWLLDHDTYKQWEKGSSCHLLWINGDPGKGKTMLLCGIIDALQKDPTNTLSYFFCQASERTLNNATSILRGLVYSIAHSYPQLVPYIRSKRPAISSQQFVDLNAWETLSDILEHTLGHPHLQGIVLLLDALDECIDMDGRLKLVNFVRRVSSERHVKFVITSRGWRDIRNRIGDETDGTLAISLEENERFISTTVAAYIDREVQSLAKSGPYRRNPEVLTTVKNHLLRNAQDTFLWVALVCKELRHPHIEEEDHVNHVLFMSPPGLNELYKRMFSQISSSKFYSDLCITILEVVSVLKRMITLEELHFILGSKNTLDRLRHAIQYCGSMLNVQDNIVAFVHQSAIDFLIDSGLEGIKQSADRHRHVFYGCLSGLMTCLTKPDIYELKVPGIHHDDIDKPDPDPLAPLKYACVYWADHLIDSDLVDGTIDTSDIQTFCEKRFLYWVEVMSLLDEIHQAIQIIQRLQAIIVRQAATKRARCSNSSQARSSGSAATRLSEYLNDANRFLLFHRTVIEDYPLQLYASCLVFSPKRSIVKACFEHEAPNWITILSGLEPTWPACIQTRGPKEFIMSVAYSHDGRWLVSGSTFGEVKLWYAATGTCVRTVDDDNRGRGFAIKLLCVAFSCDDTLFISGSSDGVVKIWDRRTGSCIKQLEAHPPEPRSKAMAISSDGGTAVYALSDDTIIVSKILTDPPSRMTKHVKMSREAVSVALSVNGLWVAVTDTSEKTIRIFNTSTEDDREIIVNDPPYAVAWSGDGDWIASGGYDGVRIWERESGQLLQEVDFRIPEPWRVDPGTIRNHEKVENISFSTDKKLLAAISSVEISIWNTTTAVRIWTIDRLDESGSNSTCFSPDATRLISRSLSRGIQVWDLSIVEEHTNHHPIDSPSVLFFSIDDHLIEGYSNGLVRILHNTGEVSTFHGPASIAVALSQDKQWLASSGKEIIIIWDVRNGQIVLQICRRAGHIVSYRFHSGAVSYCTECVRVAFSRPRLEPDHEIAFRDSSEFATGFNGLIKFWSTSDGSLVRTFDSGTDRVSYITFSSDGRLLACIAHSTKVGPRQEEESIVKIWDIATGKVISTSSMGYHFYSGDAPRSLSFSVDTRLIAAVTPIREENRYTAICLWEVGSESLLRTFRISKWYEESTMNFDTRLAYRLHTNSGYIDLTGYIAKKGNDSQEAPDAGAPEIMSSFCGYGTDSSKTWIVRDGKRFLWIPTDFRPIFRYHSTIAVGDGSSIAWARRGRSPVWLNFEDGRWKTAANM